MKTQTSIIDVLSVNIGLFVRSYPTDIDYLMETLMSTIELAQSELSVSATDVVVLERFPQHTYNTTDPKQSLHVETLQTVERLAGVLTASEIHDLLYTILSDTMQTLDSSTTLLSQRSVSAYVDNNVPVPERISDKSIDDSEITQINKYLSNAINHFHLG